MVRNLINFPPRPPADSEDFVAKLDKATPESAKQDVVKNDFGGDIAEVWDALGLLGLDAAEVQAPVAAPSRRLVMGGALAASLTAAIGGAALWSQRATTYRTPIGGQSTIGLDDGSRMTLNTATVVEARFHGRQREIRLVAGEAYFEVAHRDDRDPFYVTAGAARIRVVGTRFAVRLHDDQRIDIDLLEGRIRTGLRSLSAGQALRLDAQGNVIAELPADTERVQGWLGQRAYFRDTPLTEAVAEMNRYRTQPLVVDDPAAAKLRVTGVFDNRDAKAFVAAVQSLYGIRIHETS